MTAEEQEAERLRLEAESQGQNQNQSNQTDTNTNVEQLIQTTLAESNRRANAAEQRARELEDRITAMSNSNSNSNNLPAAVTNEQFWADPVASLSNLIQAQVAPIMQTTAAMKRRDSYLALKANYRSQYPAFAQIENVVDGFMDGKEPNNENMVIAIQRAVGQIALTTPGVLNLNPAGNNNQNNNTQNNPPAANNTPAPRIPDNQAHLRSNAAPVNTVNTTPKRRALNEHERRLAKQQGMSDDRYLDLLEGNNTVETWKEKK